MEKAKKIKLFIGLFYLTLVGIFLYYLFTKFSLQEITSYEFIKNNRNYFYDLKQNNLFFLATIFFFFIVIWVLAAGFGSPVAILSGFIFGKWLGTLLVVLGLSVGATLLYSFSNFFLKSLIKEKFLDKYQNLEEKFKKSEFIYLLIYRFCGGIPWQLSCILPVLFDVKVKNYLFATLLGIIPQIFLVVSIGSGLEKIISENLEPPKISDIIFSPDIYIPVGLFIILISITIIFRKIFYKN